LVEGNLTYLISDNYGITTHELHLIKASRCQLNCCEVKYLVKSNKDKIRG